MKQYLDCYVERLISVLVPMRSPSRREAKLAIEDVVLLF